MALVVSDDDEEEKVLYDCLEGKVTLDHNVFKNQESHHFTLASFLYLDLGPML